MDETKIHNLDEVLDRNLSAADKQTAGFRAAIAAADELNLQSGFRTQHVGEVHKMQTEDDKRNEAEAEDLIDRLKTQACQPHPHNTPPREEPYPNLPKGKLLFQCEEYDFPKEYITLRMKEDKRLVKKILDQKGNLTGHPEIPVGGMEWDLPPLDCITKAINEEFPNEKYVAEKGDLIAELIGKYMGNVAVTFNCYGKLFVRETETKFKMCDVHAAVKALAVVIPTNKAEKIVAKEIANMIKNVL